MTITYDKNMITGGAIQQYEELLTLLLLEADEFAYYKEQFRTNERNKKKQVKEYQKNFNRIKSKTIKSCERELNKMLRTLKIKI